MCSPEGALPEEGFLSRPLFFYAAVFPFKSLLSFWDQDASRGKFLHKKLIQFFINVENIVNFFYSIALIFCLSYG